MAQHGALPPADAYGFRAVRADVGRHASEEARQLDLPLTDPIEGIRRHDERRARMLAEKHDVQRTEPERV